MSNSPVCLCGWEDHWDRGLIGRSPVCNYTTFWIWVGALNFCASVSCLQEDEVFVYFISTGEASLISACRVLKFTRKGKDRVKFCCNEGYNNCNHSNRFLIILFGTFIALIAENAATSP